MSPAQTPDWPAITQEATRYLQDYLRFDTSNPPGKTRQAAEYLKGIFDRESIESRISAGPSQPDRANLVAMLKALDPPPGTPKKKPLVLMHHIDVVPADPSRWSVPPFSATIREGAVWARGALDTKALGIMEMMAMVLLKRQNLPLERDVIYLAVSDEEVGGQWGARWLLENELKDIDPECVLNEGGFGSRGIFTADAETVFAVSVAEKQVLWVKLLARGKAGHGSMPEKNSANERIILALNRLLKWKQAELTLPIVKEMAARLRGPLKENAYTRAIRMNTLAVSSLSSGVGVPPKVNVIPSEAAATVDCRLLPGQDPDRFLSELKSLVKADGVDVELIKGPEPAGTTSTVHPFYQLLARAFEREAPGARVVPVLLSGATDSRFFRARGVPAYGVGPFVLNEEDLALIHGHDERITLSDFTLGLKVLEAVVREFACPGGP